MLHEVTHHVWTVWNHRDRRSVSD